MTKVEHTRTHKVAQHHSYYETHSAEPSVLVTNAELVLVECKPEEALLWRKQDQLRWIQIYDYSRGLIKVLGSYLKPILISRTEKYGAGESVYSVRGFIGKFAEFENSYENECFKILALPEHFSEQQLQDIVEGKLKEGKLVVECIKVLEPPPLGNVYPLYYRVIKLNPHITIYPVVEELLSYSQWFEKYQDQLLGIPKERLD